MDTSDTATAGAGSIEERIWPVVIIGTGFGGQATAVNLLRRDIDDFLMLERRDFMGGTWQQNSYPGAAVDVQSPLYSLSFEPWPWTQMFAEREELAEYTAHVIDKYGLREKTRLSHNVEQVAWQEDEGVWHIQVADRPAIRARVLINASGPLSTPVIPNFPGRERFEGESFHTNDWNHDFDHRGKRLAIIGSGASAAQIIPAIAPDVAELHVFQRSPHWVIPRPDRKFGALTRRLLAIKPVYKAVRTAIYWGLESRIIGFKYSRTMLNLIAQRKADKHLEEQVPDEALRARLTPDFTIGCKRIILSNTLYPALMRDNVTLHDAQDGIEEVTETGIRTKQGEAIDLDCIVWSTGYDATDGMISYPVIGRHGKTLADFWADYPRAYLGTAIPGFPNLFIGTGPNTGIGHTSHIFMIESQLKYIIQCVEKVLKSDAGQIEVTPEAEARYTAKIHDEMAQTVWHTGGCNSWYKSASGRVTAMFPGFTFTYRRMAENFKRDDHRLV
ncbi:NAD(P)/FAD-dependent oxidoreductase [uncultured Salinisphaera sp.]|uniref:flavin-containing monooxygenase n=1 Tax=uncultured Salinisphaera sp. TaxID=359372 RepID=UPI0032B1D40C|tara:strand:- start:875 stop:2377 length:1503 start_codon:yes stop_codon:yes gene_type:complete